MKVVVIAGGQGTRIVSVNSEIPKAMIPIAGKPILEYEVEMAKRYGYTDFLFIIGHMGDQIEHYFEDGRRWNVNIEYYKEEKPLGTAGALGCLKNKLTEDFFVFYGDTVMDFDMDAMLAYHKEKQADATLFLHPNDHPYDSDIVELTTDGRVLKFCNKPHVHDFVSHNMVNAALFIFSPKVLEQIEVGTKSHIEKHVLPACLDKGMNLFGYVSFEYIKDMGTPDRFHEAETDMLKGLVYARNLKNKQKAIFLDRDGTINKLAGFVTNPKQFELIQDAADAIKLINKSGYLAIVVTNQPVIARGDCTFEELQTIHDKMETELGKKGAFVDAIYVCPHHTDKGFEGERPEYKCDCNCRKPKPGLFLQAAKDFNINLSQSYMIGDSDSDIEAGQNAGVQKSLKIGTSEGKTLLDLVNLVLSY